MGVVYRAHDPEIDRRVAIKLVRADLLENQDRDDFLARFRREAQAAARCAHPNIVGVYDYALYEGQPFITMELVDGHSLAHRLASAVPFTRAEAVGIAVQVLDALAAAHAVGIVHRDIKPANVLLGRDGRVKVTDFGIARLSRSDLTQTGSMIGTLSYMAPEQCRGETVDGRSDLFATGALLHEMLTGMKAFPGSSDTEVMQRLLFQLPAALDPLDDRIPPALATVLSRALAKNASDRYASAREMAAALRGVASVADDPGTIVMSAPFGVPPLPGVLPHPPSIVPVPAPILESSLAAPAAVSRPPTAPSKGGGTAPTGTGYGAIPATDATAVQRELAFFLGPIASVLVRRTAQKVATTQELWDALAAHIERAEDRTAFLRKRPR
jgi:eukaryotic-like serine/threonine-protein kinase